MTDRFEWLQKDVIYQEQRGNELRWVITAEKIHDREADTTFSRSLLRHPGVASVAAIQEGKILLIEQFRYTTQTNMWEIPTGTMHGVLQEGRMVATEDAEVAAARELKEEAGYEAARLKLVQQFYVMPGTSDGLVHLFLGFDLKPALAQTDIGEVVTKVHFFPIDQAIAMISQGLICDAKTIIGIYQAKNYQEQQCV